MPINESRELEQFLEHSLGEFSYFIEWQRCCSSAHARHADASASYQRSDISDHHSIRDVVDPTTLYFVFPE